MDIQSLEAKIDALIALNAKLSNENRALREQQSQLQAEKTALMEKTTLARQKIEAMIDRLKTLEAQQS
jgi:cell division protein ZapB